MRKILLAVIVTGAGVFAAGCNQSEPGGKVGDQTPSRDTFRVKAPTMATTVKQGDRQTVQLSVSRGSAFQDAVSLKVDAPTGITVDLGSKSVKPSDPEGVTATITVAKDAPLGEHTVTVMATPDKGNATNVDFKVKVERKGE